MNTMGKILVFINFLFALVIGGFMVIDFARRTNWKAAYDNVNAQLQISRNNTETLADSNRKSLSEMNKLQAALGVQDKKYQAQEAALKNQLKIAQLAYSTAEQKANLQGVQLTEAVAESKRRADEVANLGNVIKAREQAILKLEDDKNKYKTDAIAAQNDRDNAQRRSMSLLDQVREQQKELVRLSSSSGTGGIAKGPSSRRPPLADVKGDIKMIDSKDNGLVELNVGSDQGLADGNTLEVYRLRPSPEYLGTLVIVDAHPHSAVARLLPPEFRTRRVELRVGDEVASKLSR